MKQEIITHVIKDDVGDLDLGHYNVKFHGSKVTYNGIEYTYLSSGLCRTVYIDPDKKFVLKIPNKELYSNVVDVFDDPNLLVEYNTMHNILEYFAYKYCPKSKKKWFAKTELLDHCWLKQEYVEVFSVHYSPDLREIGQRLDGSYCLFDFDPVIKWHQRECLYMDQIYEYKHLFNYDQVINFLKSK